MVVLWEDGIGLLVLDVHGEDSLSITLFLPHWIFSLVEKKIVLVRGKESREKVSKRDEKGQTFFFHRTCSSAVT
jgi:hypothetical protein